MQILNDTLVVSGISSYSNDSQPYGYHNLERVSLSGNIFDNALRITNPDPESQPQEIYLARTLDLVAFLKNDTL